MKYHPEYDELRALNKKDTPKSAVVLALIMGFLLGFLACHELYAGLDKKWILPLELPEIPSNQLKVILHHLSFLA